MKLISITWSTTPRMPGLRPTDIGRIECDKPSTPLKDWKLVMRGQQLYLISPPGWQKDAQKKHDPKGPLTVFGPISVHDVFLEWSATAEELETLYKTGKWESEPFGWVPAPVVGGKPILEQIPAGQTGDV